VRGRGGCCGLCGARVEVPFGGLRLGSQSLAVSFASEMIAGVKLMGASVESVTDALVGFLSHLKKSGETHILGVAAGLDLSFSQLRALFVLADCQEELAVHELAERLALSMATAGRAVQALVRAELVTRREDEQDRRVKRIRLSEHGRAFVAEFVHAHREAVRECVESLTERERQRLAEALAPILARGTPTTTTTGCSQGETRL
jgi:DNA-binding MarR family transcriptional regulator